jgi:hypothetical protein
MPTVTAEKLKARTARLKKKLAEKKDGADVAAVRAVKKRIRRAQRRRRLLDAAAAKAAKKTEAKPE